MNCVNLFVLTVYYEVACDLNVWINTQVDAFTESAFKGNPAAVCLLEEEREESWMQSLATEFNLSETCYLTRIADSDRSDISPNGSSNDRFHLRWFTPTTEVNLRFIFSALFFVEIMLTFLVSRLVFLG